MNKLKAKTIVIITIGVKSWSYKVPLRLKTRIKKKFVGPGFEFYR